MSSNNKACQSDILKPAASEPLDSRHEIIRSRQDEEEILIVAAWQNMQQSLSQKDSDAAGLPQSFLAKQRRSIQARRTSSVTMDPQ
ncbi:protein Hook homolog 2-like isoform X2 [Cyprinodon tularosa]|uniref:protein Hook homolog 2-like isoform X2 n=1 Tax=Cyprinodon tularosa TaxID=77115 RepID=UPI0018E287E2|nr:protein Hook homolog 2-like isoform X2 [Cyprinodon tularosa]